MSELILGGSEATEEAPESTDTSAEDIASIEPVESTEAQPEGILPLPEDATPEQRAEFYQKLGAPKDTSGYDDVFKRDGVEWGEIDPIKEAALEAGLTPGQLEKITDAYLGVITNHVQGQAQDSGQVVDGLREEWGKSYDANLGLAIQTAKSFGGDELLSSLEASGLGNNKELIITFSRIGKALASEGIIDGAPAGAMSKKDAEAKAQSLMNSPAYLNAKDPGHARAVDEVTKLMELAYPESAHNPYI